MSTVYVVVGSTGEYSDRDEWMVAGYDSQEMAEDHARLASDLARTVYAESEAADDGYEVRDGYGARSPYDVGGRMYYTGTSYYVRAVPMRAELP